MVRRFSGCCSVSLLLVSLLGLTGWAKEAPAPKPAVAEVIVVFKTHFDIGYTDLAANVVQRYRTSMIDDALKVVDANRSLPAEQQFAWTIPGWPLAKILDDWPGQTLDRKARVEQAFREGRFVVHALPFTTHTESLDPEDLVRGLGYASRLSRAAGLPLPRDAKMTDVASHTWLVPTLLKHAGVEFLHLGCNSGSSSPEVPPLFFWEGPDGSRVLTMYSAGGYGTGLAPPADWPYRTWLAVIHTGDNHGPPRPEEVQKLLATAAKQLPGVKVRIGRLSDFSDRLLAEKAAVPVVRGDMPDTWIHGPMSDPAGAKIARHVRPAIFAAEALATHLRAWGVKLPDSSATIADATENSLLYGEHTWGGSLFKYTPVKKMPSFYGDSWRKERAAGSFKFIESTWDEHTAYIEKAEKLIRPLLDAEMQALARSVKVAGPRIVVFNPLPFPRNGLVSVTYNLPGSSNAVQCEKEIEPVESVGNTLRFVARDVPSFGYRTYVPVVAKLPPPQLRADQQSATIENAEFRVVLDKSRGVVRSLVDKHSKRELLDPAAPYGLGQYLYERFDADQVAQYVKDYVKSPAVWAVQQIGKPPMPSAKEAPYMAASPRNFTLRMEQTPVSVSAVMEAPAGADLSHGVTTRLTLFADEPYVDLEITVHNKPADSWPEAGWLCMPFRVPDPQFRLARPGSIIDPAKDIVRGANHNLFALSGGLTVTDPEGWGVGLCPADGFLVSLDTPGCEKYSRDFVPRKPYVFLNLFNNQWTTNFRLWNSGTWSSRVRIWALDPGAGDVSDLLNPSQETRQPLQAAAATGAAGTLPATQEGLSFWRRYDEIAVTAFGPNPDGPGTLLRLTLQQDPPRHFSGQLPKGFEATSLQPIDLRGRPIGNPLAVSAGQLDIRLKPFTPFSCILDWPPDAKRAAK